MSNAGFVRSDSLPTGDIGADAWSVWMTIAIPYKTWNRAIFHTIAKHSFSMV